MSIKVIVGCECSGSVRDQLIKNGIDAVSCDLKPTETNGPHYQDNIFYVLKNECFDAGIFFPPCTDLAVSGNAHFEKKRIAGIQQKSISFFLALANWPLKFSALENPIGIMSTYYRRPDQIINPFYFGDPVRKPTCLWLNNLPKLTWSDADTLFYKKTTVCPEIVLMKSKKTGRVRSYSKWEYEASTNQKQRAEIRSKTFPGVAVAMGDQWAQYLKEKLLTNGK